MAKAINKTEKEKNREAVNYNELAGFIGKEFKKRDIDIKGIKGDIVGMKGDIKGIKGEITGLKTEITGMKVDIVGIKGEIQEMKADIVDTKNVIMTAIDGLAGKIDDYQTEQVMVKHELKRHEAWCEQLAQKTGVELKD